MTQSLYSLSISNVNFKMMGEILTKLAIAAQQHPPQTQERQATITHLVNEILRSRLICRPLGTRPLCKSQANIDRQVREILYQAIERELDKYRPEWLCAQNWTSTLRDRAFRQVLDDALLKQLALEIQSLPARSEQRQHLLGELIQAIRLSGKMCRPHRQKFVPAFYELLYEEAVSETLLYICRNLDKYDPQRGKDKKFMTWVNFHLDKFVIDCRRKFSSLENSFFPVLGEIEKMATPEDPFHFSDLVREYIEEDTEALFSNTKIANRPDANFRAIALARFAGKSWEEISLELGILIPTLSSFYQRCCRKFSTKFKTDLQS
jgi:DNA-directed RNA polymerase specialized sigma24 family protein